MKEQDQQRACAELDGWTLLGNGLYAKDGFHGRKLPSDLPDYGASYDAIIPLIQKQILLVQYQVVHEMFLTLKRPDPDLDAGTMHELIFQQPPAQLREALLRATGKWKD